MRGNGPVGGIADRGGLHPGVDSAGMVGIDHDDVGRACVDERLKRLEAVVVLTLCDVYVEQVDELVVSLEVAVVDGIFQPEYVVGFEVPRCCYRAWDVPSTVDVDHQLDFIANGLAHDSGALAFGGYGCFGAAAEFHSCEAAFFEHAAWILTWVGDSRAYLWDGQLGLLSQDHSLVESLVQSGQITIEEARFHPKKNVIEQAIGLQGEDNLRIGSNYGELQPGQLLMLCSDGLNDVLDSASIVNILSSGGSLEERCQQLVQSAVDRGGRDNTTVILLEARGELAAREGVRDPDFVWRYNPLDKSYSGLPELKARPAAATTQVAPRTPEGTVLLKSPLAPSDVLSEADTPERASRSRHYLFVVLGLVVSVLIAGGLLLINK